MCDILYRYLTENNILFNKQFGFRVGHLTEHALLELADQINNTFNDYMVIFLFIWYRGRKSVVV